MKKVLIGLLCITAALLLTACHENTDPWVEALPTAAPTAAPDSEDVPVAYETVSPTSAPTPVPEQHEPGDGSQLNG